MDRNQLRGRLRLDTTAIDTTLTLLAFTSLAHYTRARGARRHQTEPPVRRLEVARGRRFHFDEFRVRGERWSDGAAGAELWGRRLQHPDRQGIAFSVGTKMWGLGKNAMPLKVHSPSDQRLRAKNIKTKTIRDALSLANEKLA
jgi:hypothetical protein